MRAFMLPRGDGNFLDHSWNPTSPLTERSLLVKWRNNYSAQRLEGVVETNPMNSDQISRSGGPAAGLPRSSLQSDDAKGGLQNVRAKAGEAVSKLAEVAQEAGGQAKQAASSLATEANQKAKGLLNQRVAASADLVNQVAEFRQARCRSSRSKRPAIGGAGPRRSREGRGVLSGSARSLRRRARTHGLGLHAPTTRTGVRACIAGWIFPLPGDQSQSVQWFISATALAL